MSQVHPQARTTPLIRAEVKAATGSQGELAARYNISVATVRKWQNRDQAQDRSHRPHKLSTTLTQAQEAVVVELRRTLCLPIDDLLVITREFVNPGASRSGLDRCLRRHGVSNLLELRAQNGEPVPAAKTYKDYEPGFVHMDIKYLPQLPDETQRRYLFVAIARATRWVFIRIYDHQSEVSSCDFLWQVHQAAPMKITKLVTDNGSQFTDRFTSKGKGFCRNSEKRPSIAARPTPIKQLASRTGSLPARLDL